MRWNYKQIVAVVLVAIGLVAIYKARDYASQIFSAKQKIDRVTKPFANNPMGGMFKRQMMKEASQYDQDVQMLFYGGVAAIVVGALVFFISLRK